MPADKTLDKLYSGDYEFRVDNTSLHRFKMMSRRIIAELKRLNPTGTTLLDIGTGYGTFVEIAGSTDLDAIGIEPAKNLYKSVSSKVKDKIVHLELDGFIRINTKKYDFITLIHVIEHVKHPKVFLEKVFALLSPGGVLYIETPNSASHQAVVEDEHYTFLTPPDHLNLFSKESIELLIKDVTKTSVSHFGTYSYPEHLVGILRIVRRGGARYQLSSDSSESPIPTSRRGKDRGRLPFFDKVVAPVLTPLLNIGDKGSFLQVFIQKTI